MVWDVDNGNQQLDQESTVETETKFVVETKTKFVVEIGTGFLGFGGKVVREFPNARKFKTRASAEIAASVRRMMGDFACVGEVEVTTIT